jgi:NAD(P)-dependent dehydrogenase (short-subunit alcohol dehydrogenase family)
MPTHELSGTTALVTGASRGFGRAIAISSGAAVNGSPLSGGYAGAKATIRFIASYAATESGRNAPGIRFTSVLPQLTPETDLGAAGVAAYAARQGAGIPPSSTASARRSPRSR